jgi:hypothetical protein
MQSECVRILKERRCANYLQQLAAAVAVVAPAGLGCSRTKTMGEEKDAGIRAQLAPSNVTGCRGGGQGTQAVVPCRARLIGPCAEGLPGLPEGATSCRCCAGAM